MNPAWAKARGELKDSWNLNEKAAAYLCSPVNATNKDSTDLPWKNYYDENAAEYVIGGPSAEMYVKSYNEAYTGVTLEDGKTAYTLGANYSATNPYGYKYTVDGTEQDTGWETEKDTLDYTKFDSMYCGKDGEKVDSSPYGCWLASPSAGGDDYVCYVPFGSARLFGREHTYDRAVSPLVSLKSNFIPQFEK